MKALKFKDDWTRLQAANLLIKLHFKKIKNYVGENFFVYEYNMHDGREIVKACLTAFFNSAENIRLKSAVVNSNYYNNGDYTLLVKKLTNAG